MHILGISGSLRAGSSTGAIVRAIAALAPANVKVAIDEGLADLPHFSPELDHYFTPERGESPAPVNEWRERLQAADAVVICTPEYAFGMPGSLKNALDWIVSSGELWRKPTVVLSASPSATGGEKAYAALRLTLTALEAEIIESSARTVPFVRAKLDANGHLTDPAILGALRQSLEALIKAVEDRQPLS